MSNPESQSLPDLLQTQDQPQRVRKRRRRSSRYRTLRRLRRRIMKINWRLIFVMIVAVVSVVVMSLLVIARNIYDEVNDSWLSVNRVWDNLNDTPGTELTATDFEHLQSAIKTLNESLGRAKSQTTFLRSFAFLYSDAELYFTALDASYEMTLAADAILEGIDPTIFFLTEGEEGESVATQISSGDRVVELLGLGHGQFLEAQDYLDQAREHIDELDLASVSKDMLPLVDGLEKFHAQMQDINLTLLDSPELLTEALGINETKTYLVLSQNSDEIRPSGGYISTYGWMTVRNGRIVDYSYSPTTSSSPNPPPDTLASEVNVPDWWITYRRPIYSAWDSSWYADFASTARMAAWFYDEGGNPQAPVDGVIGIDIVGFEYLLEGLGNVSLLDYSVTIYPENFRDAVYEIRAEGEGELPHKRFIATLYRKILDEWQSVDQAKSVDMRGAVLRALQEKHIMVYFTDERLNDVIKLLDWSGEQLGGVENDYIMVADANLGNKSNRSVVRQLTYDVEILEDGSLNSRLAVGYDYPARLAEADPAVRPAHYSNINYNNIMQVFVTAGSKLTGYNNLRFEPTVVSEEKYTQFISLVTVAYNESERFQYSYTTPPIVETFGNYRRYTLELEKQAGMLGEPVNVQVRLPVGANIATVSPDPAAEYDLDQPILEFRVELTTDKTIEIIYSQ